MDLSINLANRPFRDLRPLLKSMRAAMGALAVLAAALGVLAYFVHQKANAAHLRVHFLEGKVASIASEQQGYQAMMHRPENQRLAQETENLNRLFDAKAFSWTIALRDLEAVLPNGVEVAAIEPARAQDGKVTLRVRVLGPRDKNIEFVRNLELSPRFRSPRIVGESADTNRGPNQKFVPVSASDSTNLDILVEYDANAPDGARTETAPHAGGRE